MFVSEEEKGMSDSLEMALGTPPFQFELLVKKIKYNFINPQELYPQQ